MPITKFQAKIAKLLAGNRSPDSYIAGGTAMHFEPNSIRYSQYIDYFHDSEKRVAEAFDADAAVLKRRGIELQTDMHQPGYIRAIARQNADATKIEWAHDSAWRFMPTDFAEDRGFTLSAIDLAINKVLALAGRDEPRDYLDVLDAHAKNLSLPGLVWAACGKDPGFTPHSLLELLQRKGKYRPEDFQRLRLNMELDLPGMKKTWIDALQDVQKIITELPANDVGCLYYDKKAKKFVVPDLPIASSIVPHFATEGGILPKIS